MEIVPPGPAKVIGRSLGSVSISIGRLIPLAFRPVLAGGTCAAFAARILEELTSLLPMALYASFLTTLTIRFTGHFQPVRRATPPASIKSARRSLIAGC